MTLGCGPQAGLRRENCPAGDQAWRPKIESARKAGTLDALREQVRLDCQSQPTAWEPKWVEAETYKFSGKSKEALEAYHAALERALSSDDPVGIAINANRIAFQDYVAGQPEVARKGYETALQAAQRAKRDDLVASVLNNLAGTLTQLGELAEAQHVLQRAYEGFNASGNALFANRALSNRGILLRDLGDATGAEKLLKTAYEQGPKVGDSDIQQWAALGLAQLYLSVRDDESAAAWLERQEFSAANQQEAQLLRGRLELRRERWPAAKSALERATTGDNSLIAMFAHVWHAHADWELGNRPAARTELDRLIARARDSKVDAALWMALWRRGAMAIESHDMRQAALDLDESIAVLERETSGLRRSQEDLRFLRERADPFVDRAVVAALHEGPQQALAVVRRAQARTLRRTMRNPDNQQAAAIDWWRALPSDTAELIFLLGDRRSLGIVATRTGLETVVLPGLDQVGPPLRRWRAALKRPLESATARLDPSADLHRNSADGDAVYRQLIAPLLVRLKQSQRLYIVADRDLWLVPLAAIPDGHGGWLGDRFEIGYLPLPAIPAAWSSDQRAVLLAGYPLPDPAGEWPILPHSAAELDAVKQAWSQSNVTTLRGEQLSLQALQRVDLQHFGLLHFATHAEASASSADRCRIVLSRGETLGLDQVATLTLDRALVVLSACRSGEGEVIPGEGVVGLGWGLMQAGAASLVLSQWSVEDESGAAFMAAFHRRLAGGNDPVAALSATQRELRRTYMHPSQWAPFVVVMRPSQL